MNLGVEHLKVDQTSLNLDNYQIFVTNINIPERYLNQVRPILQRADNFILNEYEGAGRVFYQLVATYYLKHSDTGHLRHWGGSFLPKEINLSSIDSFHAFGPNFVNRLELLCNKETLSEKLSLHNIDTEWEFHSLTSVVINVQAKVPDNFTTLVRRNLREPRHGRHKRVHNTIPLP